MWSTTNRQFLSSVPLVDVRTSSPSGPMCLLFSSSRTGLPTGKISSSSQPHPAPRLWCLFTLIYESMKLLSLVRTARDRNSIQSRFTEPSEYREAMLLSLLWSTERDKSSLSWIVLSTFSSSSSPSRPSNSSSPSTSIPAAFTTSAADDTTSRTSFFALACLRCSCRFGASAAFWFPGKGGLAPGFWIAPAFAGELPPFDAGVVALAAGACFDCC
mmetsp:Transcript_19372/g.28090  ORF Transcript_19372/g.28090 Transcript_19372/m.28090 type:complete len:215 (+) Transcript_19372:403-1047(+)